MFCKILWVLYSHRYDRRVIYVRSNDTHLWKSAVTTNNIKKECKLAQTKTNAANISSYVPVQHSPEAFSRLWVLNNWMSKWLSENNVFFIDYCYTFKGKPGIHPSWNGAAFLQNSP